MAPRGKGEGGIYQRADGTWCASIELPPSLDGKRRRKVIRRKSKADLVKEMRSVQNHVRIHGDVDTNENRLADWMTYYLDEIMPARVHPNVIRDYRRLNTLWITPSLGKKKLTQVTGDDIHKLVRRLQREPKDPKIRATPTKDRPEDYARYSQSYVRGVFNLISGAYKEAVRRGKAFYNPCDQTDRPELAKTDEKALTPEQATHLLKFIAERPDAGLWATYLLTGARRAEVIGLEVDRVGELLDFSWQLQDIKDVSDVPARWEHRHVRGNLYLTRPKTSSGWRIVPALPIVRALIERSIGDRTEGFVFVHPGTGECWRPDTAYKTWRRLLKDAGLPHVKLHGTRHTFIDLLFDAGVSEAVIMELVGHSTRAMSRAYRTRGAEALKRDAVEKVGSLLQLDQ